MVGGMASGAGTCQRSSKGSSLRIGDGPNHRDESGWFGLMLRRGLVIFDRLHKGSGS
jgi:hypothetical protein